MNNSRAREMYRLVRYDYYHAGRLLHMIGNFHSAGIMLGYSVETTMKAGLLEVLDNPEENNILKTSHDLKKIFLECKKYRIFQNVKISEDFFKHMDYHFQRYPSQMNLASKVAQENNDVIGNSIDWIYYYDDVMIQLDSELLKITSDILISIFYHAMRTLETKYARDILQKNAAALSHFEKYSDLVTNNLPNRTDLQEQIKQNLSKGALFYWDTNNVEKVTLEKIKKIKNKYSAETFILPKWEIEGNQITAMIP